MYEEDKGKDIRTVPKLVFSQRVASQIQVLVNYASEDVIDRDAKHNAQIIHFLDRLFDSMNSNKYFVSGKSLRSATSNTSDHAQFWSNSIEALKGMYFIKGQTKFIPPSIKN